MKTRKKAPTNGVGSKRAVTKPSLGGCGPDCACFQGPREKLAGARRTKRSAPIYLDHAATTPVRPEVLEAMLPYLKQEFGNPSSIHRQGRAARDAVERARRTVARCIGARPEELIFTGGGTESNNLAIQGLARAARSRGRHLVTSRVEHHAVLNTMKFLEREGYEVTYVPVDRFGLVDPARVASSLRKDTTLVSLMLANNETGTVEPVREIAALARKKGIPVHTDAVQAVGKIAVDVDELGVDLLSISGHKLHGPKGIGALYVRRGTRFEALLHGGQQEEGRRAGTENVAGIVGLATAIKLATAEGFEETRRLAALRARLENGLREKIDGLHVNGHTDRRLPQILNVSLEGVEGESVLLGLDLEGIAVGTGSACSSGTLEPSHVLAAMGVDPALARGSVRFSLGHANTEEEMDAVVEVLAGVAERLRRMSPTHVRNS